MTHYGNGDKKVFITLFPQNSPTETLNATKEDKNRTLHFSHKTVKKKTHNSTDKKTRKRDRHSDYFIKSASVMFVFDATL